MVSTGRFQALAAVTLVAFLFAAAAGAIVLWIQVPLANAVVSPAADGLEQALDKHIFETMADFEMWNRINAVVQSATILLGLAATLLTALTSPRNADRIKIATVSVTALTAALIGVQSTFHLKENLHTDATAFTGLVRLETDYVYARDHLAEVKTDEGTLKRDTEQKLTQIRVARMLSLAAIGDTAQRPEPEAAARRPAP